jgi:hypothetical protein
MVHGLLSADAGPGAGGEWEEEVCELVGTRVKPSVWSELFGRVEDPRVHHDSKCWNANQSLARRISQVPIIPQGALGHSATHLCWDELPSYGLSSLRSNTF